MAHHNKKNFMEDMQLIIHEIENLKIEPEECNVSCPPFGCPQEPCPGQFMNTKGCGFIDIKVSQNSSKYCSDKNKNLSLISTCQVPSTKPRYVQPESRVLPNSQSLVEICFPPVYTRNNSFIQNRQQYCSKSTPLNHLHQHHIFQSSHLNSISESHKNQNSMTPTLKQKSCPQSCIFSIPFREI
ncbi:uncharacterized protein LOC141524441 [Cotesia typhae]|uniref:uncharacterized protein LOC141524441 n=1 Tax=Cotesia typhae TaxID=2053667 RepID=UPI003D69EC59